MASDEVYSTFRERHKELCLLSSFISKQEQWLNFLLEKLCWSRDTLNTPVNQGNSLLVPCPFNKHHYVSPTSLETHKYKCMYEAMGVDSMYLEESGLLAVNKGSPRLSDSLFEVNIDTAIEKAVTVYANDPEFTASRNKETAEFTNLIQKNVNSSLEDSQTHSLNVSNLKPHQIISYINSWSRVPPDWANLTLSSLDLARVKGWLFKNLPVGHAHSTTVGGEITAVNSILESLTLLPGQPLHTSITPDVLMKKFNPLLRSKTRDFVFSLWKFVHISRLQTEHDISDSTVDDIAPMTTSQLIKLGGAPITDIQSAPLILPKILSLAEQEVATSEGFSQPLPLPMDAVFYTRTPAERRLMYDYVIETSQSLAPKEGKFLQDPDLFRDDVAALKAQLKAQAQQEQCGGSQDNMSFPESLRERKEKRDYKRRRQKYRARNVHITRRKTSEIYRDIINNRMEELRESISSREDNLNPEIDLKISETSLKQSINIDQHDSKVPFRHQVSSTDKESAQHLKESSLTSKSPIDSKEIQQRAKSKEDKDTGDSLKAAKKRKHHHSRSRSRSHSKDRSHRKDKKHHHKSHSRRDSSRKEH